MISLLCSGFIFMGKLKNILGIAFGRLIVVGFSSFNKYGRAMWLCKCNCGNFKIIASQALVRGKTKSCGCYNMECILNRNRSHGESQSTGNSVEYRTWASMKRRCYNKNNKDYPNYGGRGIKVCDRWLNSYENFLNDMNRKPSVKLSLDRINSDKDYEPLNCRWGTDEMQSRNKTNNHYIEYDGEVMILEDWAKRLKVSNGAIRYHLNKGKEFNYIYNLLKNR